MSKSIKVSLSNGLTFSSKKECCSYFSKILRNSRLNSKLSAKDHVVVTSLLERHPKYHRYILNGIKFIYVGKDIYGYRCFHIKFIKEGVKSFSFKKCIDAKEESNFRKFCVAARLVVLHQIINFKHSKKVNGVFRSDLSGTTCTKSHIDHVYEFNNIVVDFINKYKLNLDDITFNEDIPMTTSFIDDDIAALFSKYHRENAVLRVLTPEENMTRKRTNMKYEKDING